MDESVFQQPAPEQLNRFVQGDPLAKDEVIKIVLPQLYSWRKRHYPGVPEHDVQSAIHDVLNETCQKHARYDPQRALFTSYVIELIKKRMVTVRKKRLRLMTQEQSTENSSEKLSEEMYNDEETAIIRR